MTSDAILPAASGLTELGWDPGWATAFLVTALVICTVVTLAPLSRRKAIEAASQLAPPTATIGALPSAILDPLDEASDNAKEPA